MEGPGDEIEDEEGFGRGFMPYLSRESRPGEYGMRVCLRSCGAHQRRWPKEGAPELWKSAVKRKRWGR